MTIFRTVNWKKMKLKMINSVYIYTPKYIRFINYYLTNINIACASKQKKANVIKIFKTFNFTFDYVRRKCLIK